MHITHYTQDINFVRLLSVPETMTPCMFLCLSVSSHGLFCVNRQRRIRQRNRRTDPLYVSSSVCFL